MENIEYDFNKICRVCKTESPVMRYIFVDDGSTDDGPRIDEMLMACTTVVVNYGDGLPNLLCLNCSDQLKTAYQFKQLCEGTDTTLRGLLKDAQNYNIKEEYTSNATEFEAIEKDTADDSPKESMDDSTYVEEQDYEDDPKVKSEPGERVGGFSSSDFIRFLDSNQLLLTCRTCSKCFTTLDGLKCHKRLHTGSLFKCKQCGKQYTRQNHLQRHELVHGPRKVHVCKICNKTLTRFEHLKRHLITHLKEKPYCCTKCGRGFSRSEHLMNHMKKCKGDRVHICDICNKGFNRPDSLLVHKRLHDNKMPVLPTLDNLDNIGEHYVEIEYNEPNGNHTLPAFSDSDSEPEPDQETNNLDSVSQPQNSENEPANLSDIQDVANIADMVKTEMETEDDLLPVKSKTIYNKEYNMFLSWKLSNTVTNVNQTVMMEYFQYLSEKYSPNSLSTKYSILKSALIANEDINISTYAHLGSFLKQKSKGYVPRKSKSLTGDQVLTFIKDAPDESYLMHKVVLIMGIFGALRRDEMVQMTIDDIEDNGSVIMVNVPKAKPGESKCFTVMDEDQIGALKYIRQYVALRPLKMKRSRFFLAYKNNRCTVQPVGKNTIGSVPSTIARYLKLDNPKEYTGHCLRRMSSTLVVDAGALLDF